MQSVLGLVPDQRLRAVNDLGIHFLAPVSRQAVKKFCAAGGELHKVPGDCVGFENFKAPIAILVAHRHERVGNHDIGPGNSFLSRIIEVDPRL